MTVIAVGIMLLLVFAATFALGRSTGEDLKAARADGYSAGSALGINKGTAAGLAVGRQATFAKAYKRGYVAAYKRAYRSEGASPPNTVKVRVPAP